MCVQGAAYVNMGHRLHAEALKLPAHRQRSLVPNITEKIVEVTVRRHAIPALLIIISPLPGRPASGS